MIVPAEDGAVAVIVNDELALAANLPLLNVKVHVATLPAVKVPQLTELPVPDTAARFVKPDGK